MLKVTMMKYFNSSDVRMLKEKANVMFEEVSDGVYYVAKDRFDEFSTYVSSEEVVSVLNNLTKIAVTNNGGSSAIANFII